MHEQSETHYHGQALPEETGHYRGRRHESRKPKSSAGIGYTGNG
jgi:hypothetical protein